MGNKIVYINNCVLHTPLFAYPCSPVALNLKYASRRAMCPHFDFDIEYTLHQPSADDAASIATTFVAAGFPFWDYFTFCKG
eukprot:c25292_g1_i1 orf=180-422(+)